MGNNKSQLRLNKLCEKHGLAPWDINCDTAAWKELVQSIVGFKKIKKETRGRKAWSEEEINKIGGAAFAHRVFSPIDKITGRPTKKKKVEETDLLIAERAGIRSTKYDSGRIKNPAQVVKGLRNRFTKNLRAATLEMAESFTPEDIGSVCKDPTTDPDFKSPIDKSA